MVYSYGNIVTGYGAQLIRNIKLTSDSFEGMPKNLPDSIKISCQIVHICSGCVPLRYNNDKQKKPLFSRGLSVCRLLFNSFSKSKIDENYKEKRRLFY